MLASRPLEKHVVVCVLPKLCCPHHMHTYPFPSREGGSQSTTLVLPTGGVALSLGSEAARWGRRFPLFTTEILLSLQFILWWAFPLIIFRSHLFMFRNVNLDPKKESSLVACSTEHEACQRAGVWSAGVAASTLFYHHVFGRGSAAGWSQWVVVLNAAALLAEGKLLACLPPCLLLKYLWGGQAQPQSWCGDNDLNVSEIRSVKPEIQTLFTSPC